MDVSNEDFCIHVLNNLPSKYEVQVSKLEDRLGSVSNPLKIEDLQNELNLKYARMKKEDMVDQALSAVGKYKGRCKTCSKYRHGSSQCWFWKRMMIMMIKMITSQENKETSSK